MTAAPYRLPYGRDTIEISVPGDLLCPRPAELAADEEAEVWRALREPIGSPPLEAIVRPGERVAVLVNDITRLTRTDLLLPPLIETLNRAGVPDSDIFIVFALGIHRRQTDDERRRILGDEIFRRIRSFDHDCFDDANLVTVGRTSFGNVVEINRQVIEADRVVLTGEIIYHLIAGYSGGRKSLVPGVAGFRTTTFNHRMIFDPRCRPGALEGNPAHEDLMEACRLVRPDFLLNVVLSPNGALACAVAGHYEHAHRAGCRAVDRMLRAGFDEPYDLIIASAGGHPLDIDLRQAHKGLENACLALKPGGAILFYAECPDGAGIPVLRDYVFRYRDDREMAAALEREFVVGGHKAYWIARLGRLYNIHLVSSLDAEFVRRCHLHPNRQTEHEQVLSRLVGTTGISGRIAVMPHAGFTLPRQIEPAAELEAAQCNG
ncbi:MAG: nickel-dependent lactate racemase [Bryobacteraceae bacterium]